LQGAVHLLDITCKEFGKFLHCHARIRKSAKNDFTMPVTKRLSQNEDKQQRMGNSKAGVNHTLLKLVQACEKHKTFHKEEDSKSSSIGDEDVDQEAGHLPEKCRQDLKSVRAWLPRVEQNHLKRSVLYSAKGVEFQNITANQVSTDAIHLCSYYRSIVDGGFCPHSLFLLDEGRGGVESKSFSGFVSKLLELSRL